MQQQLYSALTTYPGMYICYLFPIVYFLGLISNIISSMIRRHIPIGVKDVISGVGICLILLDFLRYLYLFLTHTGRLLPYTALVIKYGLGFLLWIWVLWYSYEKYLNRRVAGEQFTKRWAILIGFCVGSIALVFIGIKVS